MSDHTETITPAALSDDSALQHPCELIDSIRVASVTTEGDIATDADLFSLTR